MSTPTKRHWLSYVFVGSFVSLLIATMAFTDKFPFLQEPEAQSNAQGCPDKCCKACTIQWTSALLFATAISLGVVFAAAMLHHKTRSQIVSVVKGVGASSE